jgi:hypothetical protein
MNYPINYKKYVLLSTIIFLIGFFTQIGAFIITNNNFVIPSKWIINMVAKCGETSMNESM